MQISNKQLQEIIRLRALIEVDNLEMMVGRISPEQIAQIKAHILETDRKLENGTLTVRNHWENNIAFHKMLYSMSNNQFGRFAAGPLPQGRDHGLLHVLPVHGGAE